MISKEKIKFIRSLHKKKFRDMHSLFLIEGPKMLEEALRFAPEMITHIYAVEELSLEIPSFVDFQLIDAKALSQISNLKHPQKLIAICNYFEVKKERPDFYLALDTIQDPGNLGTILRLAAWFGVDHIIASKETVDCYNPKVVQASMGAIFTVAIEYVDLVEELSNTDLPIYGALLEGENIYQSPLTKKGVLVMGNEGNGIKENLIPLLTHPVSIPKFGKGESLNVAMATAVFLSEFSRS